MPRYFLEVAYKGTGFSGFQIQENANSVQAEIEKAFAVYFRETFQMTGSSRTDTGVHALQNFFHFDFDGQIAQASLYNINSILPDDIVVRNFYIVEPGNHSRFDAESREYHYYIHQRKDPFLRDRAYYYPYKLDMEKLQAAANILSSYTDFTSFSKRNTQTKTFLCSIIKSEWIEKEDCYVYQVKANRFLRGMVRGLTGTMLQVGRNRISVDDFKAIIQSKDCTRADFSVPAHGLFLTNVNYPEGMLKSISEF
ncbi:MAG: tRNA pseudouridine(38-40) synthase TruA [Bacteroidetes bacterium]|nr:tRNA pseudouridine(38-40) synthase TruA [Bacteroidota bacterium]